MCVGCLKMYALHQGAGGSKTDPRWPSARLPLSSSPSACSRCKLAVGGAVSVSGPIGLLSRLQLQPSVEHQQFFLNALGFFPSPPCFKGASFSRYVGLCSCCTGRTSGDGCAGLQLGKIMNEVDCGWQRPSLKRNESHRRDGILTRPSPPPLPHPHPDPDCRPVYTLIRQR